MVTANDSTVVAMREKIRRLTASPDPSQLSNSDIDKYLNTFYDQDFPYAIKLDQLRDVYEIFTTPYVDKYSLDVNVYQGIRSPIYIEGREGYFYKDRGEFYRVWPRVTTQFTPATGDGVTTTYTWTIQGPFFANDVTIGFENVTGGYTKVEDNGAGGFVLGGTTTPVTGSVDYVTGAFSITFPIAPQSGADITVWVKQYTAGRPRCLLFWNDYFIVRPVPDLVYRIEVEAYRAPNIFALDTDSPILRQWWQYIAFGAAIKVLEDRQDIEGIANLMPSFKQQEALVLERQGVEEINQRNSTIFSGANQNLYDGYQGWL
jgi:hypothetical protein